MSSRVERHKHEAEMKFIDGSKNCWGINFVNFPPLKIAFSSSICGFYFIFCLFHSLVLVDYFFWLCFVVEIKIASSSFFLVSGILVFLWVELATFFWGLIGCEISFLREFQLIFLLFRLRKCEEILFVRR